MKINPLRRFTREAKPLLKKYASLERELAALFTELAINPTMGAPLGRGCYKVRIGIASKGQGKSGGARIITCVVAVLETVYLLSIYDKADQASISDQRLRELLAELPPTPPV